MEEGRTRVGVGEARGARREQGRSVAAPVQGGALRPDGQRGHGARREARGASRGAASLRPYRGGRCARTGSRAMVRGARREQGRSVAAPVQGGRCARTGSRAMVRGARREQGRSVAAPVQGGALRPDGQQGHGARREARGASRGAASLRPYRGGRCARTSSGAMVRGARREQGRSVAAPVRGGRCARTGSRAMVRGARREARAGAQRRCARTGGSLRPDEQRGHGARREARGVEDCTLHAGRQGEVRRAARSTRGKQHVG
jgi:hypothetical protein